MLGTILQLVTSIDQLYMNFLADITIIHRPTDVSVWY